MRSAIGRASLCALAALSLAVVACAGKQVGPHFADAGGVAGAIEQNTPSPNVLKIDDADKRGYLAGTGPGQYTAMNDAGVQTFRSGSTPGEVYYDAATGRLTLSSGADVAAKGVEFDPATGKFTVAEFSMASSEPVRALNEALDRLVPAWSAMTDAEREAVIAESNNIRSSFGDLLAAALKAAAGIP